MASIDTYATPPRLYRYRSITDSTLSREIDAITSKYIYCPTIDRMNDPMEGMHRASAMFGATKKNRDEYAAISTLRLTLGIASLSETYNHEPMWAHYAGQFHGICVSYNFRQLLSGMGDEIVFARMNYSEDPPIMTSSRGSRDDNARLSVSTKTVRWASEREWRLIAPVEGRVQYANAQTVRRIYLGSRIANAHEEFIRQTAGPLGIKVLKMNVDQYQISFKELPAIGSTRRSTVLRRRTAGV